MPRAIISHYTFDIPTSYEEGHILTSSEAAALNWMKLDAIREVVRRWLSVEKDLLTPQQINEYQSRINSYTANFQFTSKLPHNKKSLLEMEREAVGVEALATQQVYSDSPAFNDALKQILSDNLLLEAEARRRVKQKLAAISPDQIGL